MRGFLGAAKAKKLDRVAAAYAVAGWLLVQVASIVFPTFAAPAWALRTFIAITLIGFPVALFVAWFSIPHPHPEAIAKRGGLTPGDFTLLGLLGGVLLLSLAQLTYQFVGGERIQAPSLVSHHTESSSGSAPPQKSIAVLPFENLSADKDAAYFAAGIQDEILTRLTKIGALKVISRTSTVQYASKPGNLREIAKELGVANILEGSVQKVGDNVHIDVQLIRAASDDHLWAEIYDRKLGDYFAVEGEVATAIAETLDAKVTGEEKQAITTRVTDNPQAYDAYLRGLALYDKADTSETAQAAQKYLEQAVQIDPAFATAWALLSQVHAYRYFHSDASEVRRAAARSSLDAAARLQPNLAEVELAQGYYQYWIERDYVGADRRLETLRSKWPNNAEVLTALGYVSRRLGHWGRARACMEQAVVLDPTTLAIRFQLASLLADTHDFAAALKVLDAALDKWPDDPDLIGRKALVYQQLGELDVSGALLSGMRPESPFATLAIANQARFARRGYAGAIAQFEEVSARDPLGRVPGLGPTLRTLSLAGLESAAGDTANAKARYSQVRDYLLALLKSQPGNALMNSSLAEAYGGLDDRDTAMKYADRAVQLLPTGKDAADGPIMEITRARIEARFGDRDHAIAHLARLLKMPNYLTPSLLRLDPDFDQLRGDRRFEALLKQ
jgi:TolB-like protein/Tfp pilus assembly protein PilF